MSRIIATSKDGMFVVLKNQNKYVTIDTEKKDVVSVDDRKLFNRNRWNVEPVEDALPLWQELANNAVNTLAINDTTSVSNPEKKIFRVPQVVQENSLVFGAETVSLQDIYGFVASGMLVDSDDQTKNWVQKVMENYPVDSGEGVEEKFFYTYKSEDEPYVVTGLYRLDGDQWMKREKKEWVESSPEDETKVVEITDADETKDIVFVWADENPDEVLELSTYFVEEFGLFNSAYAELDLELLDRAFDIYDTQERSINAQKQVRGPGGRFVKNPKSAEPTRDTPVARLAEGIPLIENPAARIDEYLKWVEEQRSGNTEPATDTEEDEEFSSEIFALSAEASGAPESDIAPLYVAVVDDIDTDAVLEVLALVPPQADTQGDVIAWKRENGQWIAANEYVQALRGSTPPSVKELKDPTVLQNVIDQVDKATAIDTSDVPKEVPGQTEVDESGNPVPAAASAREVALGIAFYDGSLVIRDADSLKYAINHVENYEHRLHVIKRAKALNRRDLLPKEWSREEYPTEFAMWGPYGELLPLTAAGGVDRNRGNAERLRRYWTYGLGGKKIAWGTPRDWTRCVALLSKHLGVRAKGYCQLRHIEMNGYAAGDKRNR